MTTRRSLILAASAVSLSGLATSAYAGPNSIGWMDRMAGWKSLFNGTDLTGWRLFKGGSAAGKWAVEDGALALKSAGGANIVSEDEFGDFDLKFDWKVSPNGNSGVMYYVKELDTTSEPYQTGVEYQVLDNAGHADGKIPSHTAGAIYDLVTPSVDATLPVGQWNRARIVSRNGHIEHWLNGKLVAQSSYGDDAWRQKVAGSKFKSMPAFGTFSQGRICLQDHGDPVWYRNIRIRRL